MIWLENGLDWIPVPYSMFIFWLEFDWEPNDVPAFRTDPNVCADPKVDGIVWPDPNDDTVT